MPEAHARDVRAVKGMGSEWVGLGSGACDSCLNLDQDYALRIVRLTDRFSLMSQIGTTYRTDSSPFPRVGDRRVRVCGQISRDHLDYLTLLQTTRAHEATGTGIHPLSRLYRRTGFSL